jgi:hypothetical protein
MKSSFVAALNYTYDERWNCTLFSLNPVPLFLLSKLGIYFGKTKTAYPKRKCYENKQIKIV